MPTFDLTLPYITPLLPGIGGVIRKKPEYFIVEEVQAYEPLGYGDHLYVNITKKERTTREIQIELAKLFDLKRENVGHAGLKDKHAVSTQTFSLLLPEIQGKDAADLIESTMGVKVNWAKRHPKKLRSGHLKGNRFTITITDMDVDQESCLARVKEINEVIAHKGVPNFFGSQRIGKEGRNVADGFDLLTGKYRVPSRWLRRFLISSYCSYLSNRYLTLRIQKNLFTNLLKGDLAKKHDTGGVFEVEDPTLEQPRFDAGEISYTTPIFGYKMRETKFEAHELEVQIFRDSSIDVEDLRKYGVEGTRRIGRLLPRIAIAPHHEGITINFTLPAGGYATTILREFMKSEERFEPSQAIEIDEDVLDTDN